MVKWPDDLKQRDMTKDEFNKLGMRARSKPKSQNRESDSTVEPELKGQIKNSQASASDWRPK